jgi:hypothetical protein
MNIIRLSATNPHITCWYSESLARLASCGFTILIGVVPVGVATGAGAVGAGATGATGAVGATTTGAVTGDDTVVVTGAGDDTGADTVVVTGAGVATVVVEVVELLVDPPPPPPAYTTGAVGAELSTGIGVVFLAGRLALAISIVVGVIARVLFT